MTASTPTQDPNKPRCCAMRMGTVLWLLWAVLGWMAYHVELSAGKQVAMVVFAAPNAIPALMEQWLTSRGLDGTANPGQVPYSFLLFLGWGIILWLPIFSLRNPKRPRLRGWLIEFALLLLVSIPWLFLT